MDDTARQLGVQLNSYKVGRGIVGGLKYGSIETVRWASDTVEGLFSKQIKNAGGIVAIGYATSNAVGSQKNAVEAVFFLLAQLSLGLAVLNLIPWPVLDGGHIVYLLVEKIRGRKLAPSTWYAIQSAGLVIIVMLAIFMVGYDVLRIGKWTGLQ
jgi:regulator of sigma E protease